MSEVFVNKKEVKSELTGDLVFTVDIDIDKTDTFATVYDAFIAYKSDSPEDELPAPTVDDQKDYESVNDLFGKDTPNYFPKPKVKKENLHHVHVFDGSKSWNAWINKEQYRRSCDTLLFYSYFKNNSVRYFHLLDFLFNPENDDKSHNKMKDDEYMQILADKAECYRESSIFISPHLS